MVSAEPFLSGLQSLVRSGCPIVHLNTHEEERCLKAVCQLAARLDRHVIAWSTSRGCYALDPAGDKPALGQRLADLTAALDFFEKQVTARDRHPGGYFFVLLDPYPYLSDPSANPIYRRRLRDFAISVRAIVTASHAPLWMASRMTDAVWNPPVQRTGIVTAALIALASSSEIPSMMSGRVRFQSSCVSGRSAGTRKAK